MTPLFGHPYRLIRRARVFSESHVHLLSIKSIVKLSEFGKKLGHT
jgi:hypothetical protein